MRRKIKSLLFLVFVFALLMSANTSAYTTNTVTVKVFQDKSYLSMYKNQPSYINQTMKNVGYPFTNKWDINISPSYYNISGMMFEECPLGYNTTCTTSSCGSTCVNSYVGPNHHKNFDYNCYFALSTYGYSGWDLALEITSAKLCHMHDSPRKHDTCGLGMVPYIGGNFAMAKLTTSRGNPGNVRVIQHELSHCFGCPDGQCSSGQKCIMNGGYDNSTSYNLSNIWCTNCTKKFNRTKH